MCLCSLREKERFGMIGHRRTRGAAFLQPLLSFDANNGLPVCAMRERVNRYTVISSDILTTFL